MDDEALFPEDVGWDDQKAEQNFQKHGIDFIDAVAVFDDPMLLTDIDDRRDYGEERRWAIGSVQNVVLYVAYMIRDDLIWMISARIAEPRERRRYDEG